MPTSAERVTMPDSEIVVRSRDEVQRDPRASGTPDEKRSLVSELMAAFRSSRAEATTIRPKIARNSGSVPAEKAPEAKALVEKTAKILQMLRIGIVTDEIPPHSQTLLRNLDAQLGDSITQESAVYLSELLNEAINREITFDDLKQEFENLKKTRDSLLIRKVVEAFVETARGEFGYSEMDARREFHFDPAEFADPVESERERRDKTARIEKLYDLSGRIDWKELGNNRAEYDLFKEFITNPASTTIDREAVIAVLIGPGGLTPEDAITFYNDTKTITQAERIAYAQAALEHGTRGGELVFTQYEKEIYEKYFLNALELFKEGSSYLRPRPDGTFEFRSEKVAEFKRNVLQIFNVLYQKVDRQPDRMFREEFNEFHEGVILRYLKQQLEALARMPGMEKIRITYLRQVDERGNPITEQTVTGGTFKDFMDSFIGEINAIDTWKETYHDMWIHMKDASTIEKLSSYIARYPISQVGIFLSGPYGNFVEMARGAFERYLSYDIATNDNKARADLLAGLFNPTTQTYHLPDYDKISGYMKYMMRDKGINPEDDQYKWLISESLNIARGITLINTFRVVEIIASATAEKGYTGNFLYDLAAYVNPQWAWAWGRGGDLQAAQLSIPVLRAIDIDILPEKSFLKRLFTKGFVPRKIQNKIDEVQVGVNDELNSSWLDRQHEYGNLLRIFGIGGAHARNTWRFAGLNELRKEIHKLVVDEINREREERGEPPLRENEEPDIKGKGTLDNPHANDSLWYDDYLIRYVGAAAGWYYGGQRAGNDLKKAFGEALFRKGIIKERWEHLSTAEQGRRWDEYSNEKGIEVEAFGKKEELIFLVERRDMQYKGATFYSLLKRSPLDFIISITQLVPEVEGTETNEDKTAFGVDIDRERHLAYWFADDPSSLPREQDRANVRQFQDRIKKKFPGANFEYIRRVAKMWDEMKHDLKTEGIESREEQLELFRNIMSAAVERVRERRDIAMRREDIRYEDRDAGEDRDRIDRAANIERKIRDLMFGAEDGDGSDGFIGFYRRAGDKLQTDIVGGTGVTMDEENFFYRLANVWFKEDQVGVFPTSAEIDHQMLYRYIAKAGENMNKRLIGDWPAWRETMGDVLKLDQLLLNAANGHSLEEIEKLHHKLESLKQIVGEREMQKAQYYIASLVARFFQEHYYARLPFPVNIVTRLFLDKNLSLSKLSKAGRRAMSLSTDKLNEYFLKLSTIGAIAEDGPWSYSQLSKVIGTDFAKLVPTEILPNVALVLALFIFWKFITESLKETEGKQGH